MAAAFVFGGRHVESPFTSSVLNRATLDRSSGRVIVPHNAARGLCAFLLSCDVDAQLTSSKSELRQIQLRGPADMDEIESLLDLWHETNTCD